jgi:hypothetical protein
VPLTYEDLDREQRRTVDEIDRQARKVPKSLRWKFRQAALATGLVEDGLHNSASERDHDSQNWRQERRSIYGPAWERSGGSLNLRGSVGRFRQEFLAHADPGEAPWEIAGQVQRPAAQYLTRYRDVAGDARSLRHSLRARGGAPVRTERQAPGAATAVGFEPGPVTGAQAVQEGLLPPQALVPTAGISAPVDARAALALPEGYQPPASSGGGVERPSLADAMRQVAGQAVSFGEPGGGGNIQRNNSRPDRRPRVGTVKLAPGADRAGVPTSRRVLGFAADVAGIAGVGKVTIGTGTNHSKYTVNGNVSNHWDGNAADIPAAGRRLIELGQAALIRAGMPEKEARKQTGGLYNVGGWQIIFNTQEGGDHTGHLHAGWRGR